MFQVRTSKRIWFSCGFRPSTRSLASLGRIFSWPFRDAGARPDPIPSRLFAAIVIAVALVFSFVSASAQSPRNPNSAEYILDTGDQVKIVVFGHADLSGQFVVSSTGKVSMPLIGEVNAKGLNLRQLEQAIIRKLRPDFLKNPQVSAEVANYRPFYIIGEVKNPGTYPYVNGMRILNAVAIAGGFTYRARENEMLITRAKGKGKPQRVSPNTKVFPGDVIEVMERYF